MRTHTWMEIHTPAHTQTHRRRYTYVHTHTRTWMEIHTCIHTQGRRYTDGDTHASTHTDTWMEAYTHAQLRTHTGDIWKDIIWIDIY